MIIVKELQSPIAENVVILKSSAQHVWEDGTEEAISSKEPCESVELTNCDTEEDFVQVLFSPK